MDLVVCRALFLEMSIVELVTYLEYCTRVPQILCSDMFM